MLRELVGYLIPAMAQSAVAAVILLVLEPMAGWLVASILSTGVSGIALAMCLPDDEDDEL